MKRINIFILSFILLLTSIIFTLTVSADENDEKRLNFDNYNISLSYSHPQNWFYVTQDNMSSENLDIFSQNKDTMLSFLTSNNIIYYSINKNNTAEIRVSIKSTQLSKNIYNFDKGNYKKVTEYIDSLESINVLPPEAEIISTSERYAHTQTNFAVIEYKNTKDNTFGICYSTIVNGMSVNIDCRYKNSSIEKTLKNDLKSFVGEIEFKFIDNPDAFDKEQIFIASCGIFIGMLFLVLLIVSAKRKKNRF